MDENSQNIDPHIPYCTCVSCQDYRLNKKASNKKSQFSKLKRIIFKIFLFNKFTKDESHYVPDYN